MVFFLSEHTGDCPFGGLVHLYVPDVDAWFAEFRRNGTVVQEPPHEGVQGLRSMMIVGPDGTSFSLIRDSIHGDGNAAQPGLAADETRDAQFGTCLNPWGTALLGSIDGS
jgi:hypothetical protein